MSRRQAVVAKPPVPAAASHRAELLRGMTTIRLFEERCVELYSAATIRGFVHLYIGEEAVAVGVMENLTPDDAVVAGFLSTAAWVRSHSRAVTIGVVVLGIGIFAAIQYVQYRSALTERAASELIQVRQTAASGNIPLAVRDLETFAERFDGTPAASEARLLLAQLQLAQGNAAQAVEAVQPVADARDPLLAASAGLLLAGAHEAAGEPEQAEQVYLRIAERAELDFQKREALEDAARIRAARGDADGAVQLYDQLIGLTQPDSPERDVYEMRRMEIVTSGATAATGS